VRVRNDLEQVAFAPRLGVLREHLPGQRCLGRDEEQVSQVLEQHEGRGLARRLGAQRVDRAPDRSGTGGLVVEVHVVVHGRVGEVRQVLP